MFESQISKQTQADLFVLSQEGFTNPFSSLGNAAMSSFSNVITKVTTALTTNRIAILPITNSPDLLKGITADQLKSLPYTELKKLNVNVPQGFNGTFHDYVLLLEKHLKLFSSLEKDTLVPLNNLLLKYLGKPELLNSVSNTDFKNIKLHTDDLEKFKKIAATLFDFKKGNQTLPYGKVVKSQKDLLDTVMFANGPLFKEYTNAVKQRERVVKVNIDIAKTLDKLMLRMEQKPEVYNVNKVNAETIANLVNDVASEIEFYGALQVYTTEIIASLNNTISLVSPYVKK